MINVIVALFVLYVLYVIRFAGKRASYSELMFEEEVLKQDRVLQKNVEKNVMLHNEKMKLEAD